ncbi:MAG: acyl-CoA thioesterase II [Myxococcales bacterium]|nr:acyl-CoA thioesterase II [Myxococcales bacterium]
MQALVDLLDVEQIDDTIFRGRNPDHPRPRVFGGQVAAQSLMAAGRTVPGILPHSLHAYFLRPGKPGIPIIYTVDRIRDGNSFATRRVVAIQRGEAIFNMSAQFHVEEPGPSHQLPMPEVPDPEQSLQRVQEAVRKQGGPAEGWWSRWRTEQAVEMRPVPLDDDNADPQTRGRQYFWVRATSEMPDDPLLHLCVATHTSDHSLLSAMRRPHGGGRGHDFNRFMSASLDHALWFHRPFRMDQFILYFQESPVTAGARGLSLGRYFTQDGELVASVCQEGLLRPVDPSRRGRG